ncbi:MAG TPA: acid phosphatase [Burkholderiales bacterium]|jgi:phospholipase C|nr:acid phosphatase [Burkholderiales bacterium]
MKWVRFVALALAGVVGAGCATQGAGDGLSQIEHIVVIYAENRSFDHLYGFFPGAEGIANATAEQKTQVDHDGTPLAHLPPVYEHGHAAKRWPQKLPNGPFQIDAPPVNGRMDEVLPSPIHAYFHNIEQINGGRNDKFVAMSTAGSWAMGYFDGSKMKLWQWAKEYTLADHFFMGAFGGSYLNHLWLVCACTPMDPGVPASARPQLDEKGSLKKKPDSPASVMQGPVSVFDGRATTEGYLVNTSQPLFQPSGIPPAAGGSIDLADPARHPAPAFKDKTVGDTLSAKGVSWAWYAGAWNDATADGRRDPKEKRMVIYNRDKGSPIFQPHHHPFNYFARFAPGTPDRARHLKDLTDLERDIERGTLPQVSFYKPTGLVNEHPSYTDLKAGDEHMHELLTKLRKSPQWPKMVVIVTYDENGGFWDHVPPPAGPGWGDRWGPATRVPALIISPFAKRGFVDKVSYDTTSIIKLITKRFGLEPLPGVRANAGDLTNAFAF